MKQAGSTDHRFRNYAVHMTSEVLATAGTPLFAALEQAEQNVLLISPYLSSPIARDLTNFARASDAEWRFLTCLDPAAAAGGYLAPQGLRWLLEAGVGIRHHPRLHSKTYLVDDSFGLIGSANLTGSGLGFAKSYNTEMSVSVEGIALEKARLIAREWWENSEEVDSVRLDVFEQEVLDVPRPAAKSISSSSTGSLTETSIRQLLDDARDPNRSLWIKAQTRDSSLAPWRRPHWLSNSGSNGMPKIKPGDLVANYSKLLHAVFSIVEVTSDPKHDVPFIARETGQDKDEVSKHPWVNRTIPRLVPDELVCVYPIDVGFERSVPGLAGGYMRIKEREVFSSIVRALADGESVSTS